MRTTLLIFILLFVPSLLSSQHPSQRILFVGDSITDGGWGRSGGSMQPAEERNQKDLNHLYGHSYMFLVASYLESENPTHGYCSFNRGISGYTLVDLHARWEADVAALAPDVLSILIGINDILKHYDKQDTAFDMTAWETSYRSYLDRSLEAFPHLNVVLCTPFIAPIGRIGKRSNYAQQASSVKEAAEVVRRLAADYGATLVDFADCFDRLQEQYHTLPAAHWIWDGIHPTPAGHHQMAKCWIESTGIAATTALHTIGSPNSYNQ